MSPESVGQIQSLYPQDTSLVTALLSNGASSQNALVHWCLLVRIVYSYISPDLPLMADFENGLWRQEKDIQRTGNSHRNSASLSSRDFFYKKPPEGSRALFSAKHLGGWGGGAKASGETVHHYIIRLWSDNAENDSLLPRGNGICSFLWRVHNFQGACVTMSLGNLPLTVARWLLADQPCEEVEGASGLPPGTTSPLQVAILKTAAPLPLEHAVLTATNGLIAQKAQFKHRQLLFFIFKKSKKENTTRVFKQTIKQILPRLI